MERSQLVRDCFVESNGILKSVSDKRLFKYIRLDNGFQSLLISEPKTTENRFNAACLCVKVGTFEDPPEVLGLAHLLEHAITMGSEQFPKENAFDDFLGGCGGYSNAQTEYEETFFEFETLYEDFEDALRIFASYFIRPLLKKRSMLKEIKPVDSEFLESIGDDSSRLELLFQSLIKPDHPLSKFSWGNKETLSKNVDVHKYLVDFWKKYYVASNMALIIQTEHDLEKISDLVTELFQAVPSKNGLESVPEIVNYVFTFIEFLQSKGPQKYYFDEELLIDLNHFRFLDETSASIETKKFAQRFFHCPIENIVTRHLALRYDANVINRSLEHLDRSEANIMVISQEAFNRCSGPVQNEKWTKLKYKVEEIPDEWLQTQQFDTVFDGKVFFPAPNDFIASDFQLFIPEEVSEHPIAVYKTDDCRLWFKGDNKFKRPKGCINFIFSTSAALNIQQTIAMELFTDVLMQNLKEEVYPAYVAGLEYSVSFNSDKQFILKVSGFNHKLPNLVELLVSKIVNFSCDDKLFSAIKDDIKKSYFNSFVESQQLATSIRHLILQQNHFISVDKLKHVNDISLSEMQQTAKNFFGSLFIESLIQGNFTRQQAEDIVKRVRSQFQTPAQFSLNYPQIYELPKGEQIIRLKTFNTEEKCSIVCNYFQIGPFDIRKFCLLELLMKSMEEPLFDTLRTQQGLGYEVSNWFNDNWGIGGFCILVVSPTQKFTCDAVEESIEKFLKEFSKKVESMPESLFKKLVRSRIQAKSVPDLHLKEEFTRNFEELISRNYCFDRLNREIDCLKQITQPEFQRWSLHQILQFPSRRKLSIQVVGNVESENGVCNGGEKVYNLHVIEDKNNAKLIKDIASFKQSLNLFPPTFVKN
ncbi:nardilysin-like isoform X3 [Leptotrombidium deliense]|uniref:Nardilysin-like isoform X3 n=1 Tax=Leptotrombidium deliense TaxID=299467 RepID=A0A443S8B0_9ACAR|nr:nardilysin-like isoform X3 [Leptotrombidium deliense]